MNLSEKLPIVAKAIDSISTHSDEDAAVRLAALERIIAMAEAAKTSVQAEVAKGIEAALGPK